MCIHDELGRFIMAGTTWREPCLHIQEGEAWSLLSALQFVVSLGLQHVIFVVDCKVVADKVSKCLADLSQIGLPS